jgi:flagellar hook-associated protein 3 FlgL
MTIGNALSARLATEGFARLQSEIISLQDRVSSGENDPTPSADPVRALQLSATQEQHARLDRFAQNAQAAEDRLAMTDTALSDIATMTRQLREIALQGANGTTGTGTAADLRIEVARLRASMLEASNARDSLGQPLFAGYGAGDAFAEGPQGISFVGDGGRTSLRVSESLTLRTSLNGAEVFAGPEAGKTAFDLMDDLMAVLDDRLWSATPNVGAEDRALLNLPAGPGPMTFAFQLTGLNGTAEIAADLTIGTPGPMIDAINAMSDQTGVMASFGPDGSSIMLNANGSFSLSQGARSDGARDAVASLQPLSAQLTPRGAEQVLRPERLGFDAILSGMEGMVSNIAAQRSEAGSLAASAESQAEALAQRRTRLEMAVANLQELDIAATVTRLQTLLMTQEAAQQSFVRIQSTSLFDYLR